MSEQNKHEWGKVDWDLDNAEIAKILSCHRTSVARLRRQLRPDTIVRRTGVKPRDWTEKEIALFEVMTDADVGKNVGVSETTARNKRRSLGIPPFSESVLGRAATCQKKSQARAGMVLGPQSADVVKAKSERLKGRKLPPEVAKKIGDSNRGRINTSPKNGKFITHWKASRTLFRSPENKSILVVNISNFVRENQHMFSPEDLVWIRGGCRASKGLQALRKKGKSRVPGSWKGWTRVSFTETFYHQGEDLLDREVAG